MNVEGAVARAMKDYSMLADGDRVWIGASGGKDSLALSWLLSRRRDWAKPSFALGALRVLMSGAPGEAPRIRPAESGPLAELYSSWGIELHECVIPRLEGNALNCYSCASKRREALLSYALKRGYNVIALGHHLDDILTTALMNVVTHGKRFLMEPRRDYGKFGVRLVRPLAYVPEESIRRLVERSAWPVASCSCGRGQDGDRAEFRQRLEVLSGSRLDAKLKILRALSA